MILLSLIKELYSKIVPSDTKLTLEFLEEKAEYIFNHKKQWEKEINKEIESLDLEVQNELSLLVIRIIVEVER